MSSLKRRRSGRSVTPSLPPKRLRVSMPQLPTLPADVWYSVANYLPPSSLAALSETCSELNTVANTTLHPAVWRAVFPEFPSPSPRQTIALVSLINLLDSSPSLSRKSIAAQIRADCLPILSQQRLAKRPSAHLPPDRQSCFTVDQAVAFLDVDRQVLVSNYRPAVVPNIRRSMKRNLVQIPFQAIPPDVPLRTECPCDVFSTRDVLRAAYATHAGFDKCLEHAKRAVCTDFLRFERSKKAASFVECVTKENSLSTREVEYILNASVDVTDFRRGLWSFSFEEYCLKVREMVSIHVRLDVCYQCLLISDGNARLKAKRIVGKILRTSVDCDVSSIVKTLEGSLWWARSKSNVQKMEEMSRNMPKIRV